MVPTSLSDDGIRLVCDVSPPLGVILNGDMADLGRQIVFLVLLGHFPGPDTRVISPIAHTGWGEEGESGCSNSQSLAIGADFAQRIGRASEQVILFAYVDFRTIWQGCYIKDLPRALRGLL